MLMRTTSLENIGQTPFSLSACAPDLKTRFVSGTFYNFLATAFTQGSTFIANIVIARILLLQGFGEYAMVQSTLVTAAAVAQLATGYTVSKYIAEFRTVAPERASRVMGLCAVLSTLAAFIGASIVMVSSTWIACAALKAPHLTFSLLAGSAFVFFSVINGYQTGVFAGLEAFKGLARTSVVGSILSIATICLGAEIGGLDGAVIGLSLGALLRFLVSQLWLIAELKARDITPRYRGVLSEMEVITRFAVPAGLAGFYSVSMIWLANSFLVRQIGGYGEMGLFAAASNFRIMALFFPNILNTVGLSILNHEKGSGNTARYHRIFRNNIVCMFLVSLVVAIPLSLFAEPILKLFGNGFANAYSIVELLLFSAVSDSLAISLAQYIQSNAKIWLSFFTINVPRDGFLALAAFYLVQSLGASGLAWAYLQSSILSLICLFFIVRSLQKSKPS